MKYHGNEQFHFIFFSQEKRNSSQMTSPRRQQQMTEPTTSTTYMSSSPRITPTDWKLRCETLQFEHRLEIDRLRLHYEHELKDRMIGKEKTKYNQNN